MILLAIDLFFSHSFVFRGPKNIDVFSENYSWSTSEDLPEHIREAQQKIKDLLLQVGYIVAFIIH